MNSNLSRANYDNIARFLDLKLAFMGCIEITIISLFKEVGIERAVSGFVSMSMILRKREKRNKFSLIQRMEFKTYNLDSKSMIF